MAIRRSSESLGRGEFFSTQEIDQESFINSFGFDPSE
jgi:hypothetical protein